MAESSVPKPLSAYVGLIVASLEDARGTGRSPVVQVARLPLAAATQLLTARHRYDALAEQGDAVIEVVVGMVRQRFVGAEMPADAEADIAYDAETDVAYDTPHEATQEVAEEFFDDDLVDDDLVDELTDEEFAAAAESEGPFAADDVTLGSMNGLTDALEDYPERLDDTAPDELAADADVLTAEEVEAAVEAATAEPSATPLEQLESFEVKPEIGAEAGGLKSADDLPLEDFDHMTTAQLRGRLRTLDAIGLVQLLDYERAHANRVGIIVMLENRLAKLHAAQDPKI